MNIRTLGAMARFAALSLDRYESSEGRTPRKALIDLIQQDDSIQPDDEFYIDENGGKIKKPRLAVFKRYAFQHSYWGLALCGYK